jgi:transposase
MPLKYWCLTQQEARYWSKLRSNYCSGECKGWQDVGVPGTVPVFGLLKRGGKIYTKWSQMLKRWYWRQSVVTRYNQIVQSIQTSLSAMIYWRCKHRQINYLEKFVEELRVLLMVLKISGIKPSIIWSKLDGIPLEHTHLFLKECEWRLTTVPLMLN